MATISRRVLKVAKSDCCHLSMTFCMEQPGSLGRIFVKFVDGDLLKQNMVLVEKRQK